MLKLTSFLAALVLFFSFAPSALAAGADNGRKPAAPAEAAAAPVHFAGTVFGDNGLPLIGATVSQTGNAKPLGITNSEGMFVLLLPANAPASLTFSYQGFASQEIVFERPGEELALVITLIDQHPKASKRPVKPYRYR